jgi:RimJ/RimL family protein N-acetyltransferase
MLGESLSLRPTEDADCAFVASAEAEPDAAPYVGQWSVERHRRCISDTDTAHWVIEAGREPVGFAVLEGAEDPDQNLLLRRIVVTSPGSGYGSEAVWLLARYCFDILGFHRFWLYVAVSNERAFELYRRLGFVREGTARECMREGDGYGSMHILSLLDREYQAGPPGE